MRSVFMGENGKGMERDRVKKGRRRRRLSVKNINERPFPLFNFLAASVWVRVNITQLSVCVRACVKGSFGAQTLADKDFRL